MVKKYMFSIQNWLQNFENLKKVGIQNTSNVEGLCKKGAGGRFLFAKVHIEFSHSEQLLFDTNLSTDVKEHCEKEGWLQAVYLGVLDIMLVRPVTPITCFRCVIESIEYHKIDSSQQAFRLAARYATEKFLETEKFVMT